MNYRLSRHAEWELVRRQIPNEWLDSLLESPEQHLQQSAGGHPAIAVRHGGWENVLIEGNRGHRQRAAGSRDRLPDQQDREVLEAGVKVRYDPEVDVLSILLSDAAVEESDESKPGIVLDYDNSGYIVGIEILNASKHMGDPMSVEYAIAR